MLAVQMRKNKQSVTSSCISCLCVSAFFLHLLPCLTEYLIFRDWTKNKNKIGSFCYLFTIIFPPNLLTGFFKYHSHRFGYSYPFISFSFIPFKTHMHNAVSLQGPYSSIFKSLLTQFIESESSNVYMYIYSQLVSFLLNSLYFCVYVRGQLLRLQLQP